MDKLPSFGPRPASGFTLIELMVVVTVATILTVIAVPSYINTVRKSHRTEAKSILMDIAGREERFMATNGVYTTDPTALGLSAWGLMGSNYYSFAIASNALAPVAGTATTAAIPATFQLTATASGNQAKDTQCATFTLTSTGAQTATNTGCW